MKRASHAFVSRREKRQDRRSRRALAKRFSFASFMRSVAPSSLTGTGDILEAVKKNYAITAWLMRRPEDPEQMGPAQQ